jgi:hypothetical protein
LLQLFVDLGRLEQPQTVHLLLTPVAPRRPAEGDDPAGQQALLGVLLLLEQHGPALALRETLLSAPRRNLTRLSEVEDEDAPGRERLVYPPEERGQPPLVVLRVGQVVEDLADGRDGVAGRDVGVEQGADPELGPGDPLELRGSPVHSPRPRSIFPARPSLRTSG